MLKNRLLSFAAILAAFMVSCQKIELEQPAPDQPETEIPAEDIITFISSITPLGEEADTRASVEESGKGEFVQGDLMTLYIRPEGSESYTKSFQMEWKNGDWKKKDTDRPLTWYDVGASSATFTAYYCKDVRTFYSPGRLDLKVLTDQGAPDAFDKSDYMTAVAEARRDEPVVLTFNHMLSLVEVNFTSRDGSYTPAELSRLKLNVRAFNAMELNTWTCDEPVVTGNQELIAMKSMGNGRFRALLPAQVIRDSWKSVAWIDITSDKGTLSYKAPERLGNGVVFDRLLSGKKVTINLNLKKTGAPIVNEWAGKTVWVEGLKGIPDTSLWGYYFISSMDPTHTRLGLTWEKEYGWYDCTKKWPVKDTAPAGVFSDSNMCWAATCSNLIYWWMDRNADNIVRYGKYTGPKEYRSALDCEVFDYFKSCFTDEGYFIHNGLDWFFRGKFVNYNNPNDKTATLNGNGRNHKGFFKDVLTQMPCRVAGSATLSEDLKNAFINGEGVGLAIMVHNETGAHAITLWGAKFDENGDPCVLYVAENNDEFETHQGVYPMQPGKLCQAGIYAHDVRKEPDGQYYLESSVKGVYSIRIDTVCYLSQSKEAWDAYFAKTGK